MIPSTESSQRGLLGVGELWKGAERNSRWIGGRGKLDTGCEEICKQKWIINYKLCHLYYVILPWLNEEKYDLIVNAKIYHHHQHHIIHLPTRFISD